MKDKKEDKKEVVINIDSFNANANVSADATTNNALQVINDESNNIEGVDVTEAFMVSNSDIIEMLITEKIAEVEKEIADVKEQISKLSLATTQKYNTTELQDAAMHFFKSEIAALKKCGYKVSFYISSLCKSDDENDSDNRNHTENVYDILYSLMYGGGFGMDDEDDMYHGDMYRGDMYHGGREGRGWGIMGHRSSLSKRLEKTLKHSKYIAETNKVYLLVSKCDKEYEYQLTGSARNSMQELRKIGFIRFIEENNPIIFEYRVQPDDLKKSTIEHEKVKKTQSDLEKKLEELRGKVYNLKDRTPDVKMEITKAILMQTEEGQMLLDEISIVANSDVMLNNIENL